MGKKWVTVIIVLLIAAVLVAGSFYVLITQNPPRNPQNVRPITAGPDQVGLNIADLPSGWAVLNNISRSYNNNTFANYTNDGDYIGMGTLGLNWLTMSMFNYSSDGKMCNLSFIVESCNSTEKAKDRYTSVLGSVEGVTPTNIPLGDEGAIILSKFALNDGITRSQYYTSIYFRLGNIIVVGEYNAYDWDITKETAWTTVIMEVQAIKIFQNEQ